MDNLNHLLAARTTDPSQLTDSVELFQPPDEITIGSDPVGSDPRRYDQLTLPMEVVSSEIAKLAISETQDTNFSPAVYQQLVQATIESHAKVSIFYNRALAQALLGAGGEIGEVGGLVKDIYLDGQSQPSPDQLTKLSNELGDVCWYVTNSATQFKISLTEVFEDNLSQWDLTNQDLDFKGYQQLVKVNTPPEKVGNYHPVVGKFFDLIIQAGLVSDKAVKISRDESGLVEGGSRAQIVTRLGKVFQTMAEIANSLGIDLEVDVTRANIAKLAGRYAIDSVLINHYLQLDPSSN